MIAFFCIYTFVIFDENQNLLKKYSQIILLLFLILFGCTKKDNLYKNLNPSKDSLSIYLSLANDIDLSRNLKEDYNEKALAIILSEKDDSLNKVNLFKVANRYYNMNDLQS